jgi:hypothetical protein
VRGQSAVETALGLFVFVTVLIFGIHFAEIGPIALKVQEATNAAVWDATSQPMHDTFTHDWTLWQRSIPFAQAQGQRRYQDFDALKDGPITVTKVFTRATNLQLSCEPLTARHNLLPLGPDPMAQPAYPNGLSGIVCGAQADIVAVRIPRFFLDGTWSSVQHYKPVTIRSCAFGRPTMGQCPWKLGILLDDWGYNGQQEAQECPLAWEGGTTCTNQGYWDMANAIYAASSVVGTAPGFGSQLASFVAGASPINENQFYLSFRGRESPFGPFTETVRQSHGDVLWETTPYQNPYNDRYDAPRTNCWLGGPCL